MNYYKKLIMGNPYSIEYKKKFLNYGIAQYHIGKYKDAIQSLNNAYPYLTDNERLIDIFWKALVLYKLKRYNSAFILMKRIQNKYPDAIFWEGVIKSREALKEGLRLMKTGLETPNEYKNIVYFFNLLMLDPKLAGKYLKTKDIKSRRLLQIAKGFYELERNHPQKALNIFKKIKKKDGYIISGIISAYLREGDYEEAFHIINNKEIKNKEMEVYLGESAYGMRNYPLAESAFTQLIDAPEWKLKAYYGLGWTFYQTQSYKNAVKSFKKFLEETPPPGLIPYAIYRIGRAYLKMGDAENGLNYMKEIIEKYPQSSLYDDALFLLGKINLILNKLIIAKEYFLRMAVDVPESRWLPYAYKYVGDIYVKEKNYKKGIDYYKMAIMDGAPSMLSDEIKYRIEILKYKAGIYKTLIQAKKSFVSLYPDSKKVPSVLLQIGDDYYLKRRFNKAISYYRRVYEKFKDDEISGEALLKLSKVLKEIGKKKKAIAYLNQLLQYEAYYALAHKLLGNIYFDDENFQKAVDEYEKVVEDTNNIWSEYAQLKIGDAYINLGLYNEARIALRKFIQAYPNSNNLFGVYKKLAITYYQEGMWEDYINSLEQGADKFTGGKKGEFLLLIARAYCELNDTIAISYYLKSAQSFGTSRAKAANILKEGADCAAGLHLIEKAHEMEKASEALFP